MATTKLIGADDQTGVSSTSASYFFLFRFPAIANGSMTLYFLKCAVATNIKVALYADNAAEPGALIAAMNTGQALATGFSSVTFTETAIVSGTYYWLAFNHETAEAIKYTDSGTGARRYKTVAYSGFTFPNPAGTGFTSDTYGIVAAGWGIQVLSPSSIASAEAFGTPAIAITQQYILPTSIASAEAFGTPAIAITQQYILPSSIASAEAFGTPSIGLWLQLIAPDSIASAEAFGTLSIGFTGFIYPVSIASLEAFGVPTITKYVWHVILDGKYAALSAELNKTYVIGRDDNGINVYGSSEDNTELALVGERLDFALELEIPTTALATDVAAAILAKRRLGKASGFLLIPPNCGVELWDVVEVTDTPANQAAAKYRVTAIHFVYNSRAREYSHHLSLGGA